MDYGLGDFGDARQKVGAFLNRRPVEVSQHGIAVRSLGCNRAGEIRMSHLLSNPKVRIYDMIEYARSADHLGNARATQGRRSLSYVSRHTRISENIIGNLHLGGHEDLEQMGPQQSQSEGTG